MNLGFWLKLKKLALSEDRPILVLAPMADVTDAAFRRIIIKYSRYGGRDIGDGSKESMLAEAFRVGGPDAMWTEFVSAEGLCHPEGRKKLLIDLSYTEVERPIVAQLFSSKPEKMFEAAKLVRKLGFDGLDINMGCPDRSIEKSGAGAALMKNPKLAREIIRAAKEGMGDLPVSVKTRIGYNKNELATWLPELLAEEPAVVTIHARTRKEMSDVPARWEEVKRAVEIRDSLKSKTFIFGNGDVIDLADARAKAKETGADGVMLGRAIFGNPELFSNSRELENSSGPEAVRRRLRIMLEHTKLFDELFLNTITPAPKGQTGSRFAKQGMSLFGTRACPGIGAGFNIRKPQFISEEKGRNKLRANIKNFAVMKKHYKAYVNGFDGAKELRVKLMGADNFSEVKNIVNKYIKSLA